MITENDFSDLMQYLKVDYEGVITSKSEENVASKCFELSKKMAVEFAIWINRNRYCPTIGYKFGDLEAWRKLTEYDDVIPGETSNEELFNIYLTEQNG